MLKKVITFSVLFLFVTVTFGQSKLSLKPIGSAFISKDNNEVKTVTRIKKGVVPVVNNSKSPSKIFDAKGDIDTLSYSREYEGTYTNFGIFGQDVLVQYFQAPTDLIIKSVGFAAIENGTNSEVQVKLVKFGNSWNLDSLADLGIERFGYYPSVGDGFGEVGAFPDESTGPWVSVNGRTEPFGEDYDLWSDLGFGFNITPVGNSTEKVYQYVDMMELGVEPPVAAGEVFGIVITHQGVNRDQATERIGFWSLPGAYTGLYGWKFYENGRSVTGGTTPPGDGGWWSREFTFDFEAIVELTGDLGPTVSGVSVLNTTVSTDTRTVTADVVDTNPSGGESGVASATIVYSVDGGDPVESPMTNTGGDTYSGEIPGQVAGSEITYYVAATDNNGNSGRSSFDLSYSIFKPTAGIKTLVVLNGYDPSEAADYPGTWYFGRDDFDDYSPFEFAHDVWSFGPLEAAATTAYTNILEITSPGGPGEYNDDVIRAWLALSPDNNYLLAGQEYLGLRYNFVNQEFESGDFEYDILGVAASYNDVSYAATGDQNNPTLMYAVEGSLLGDSLYQLFSSMPTDSLNYDPYLEMSAAYANWIDVYDVVEGTEVDMLALPLAATEISEEPLPAASHRTLIAGNKIVFMSYDPLSLDSSPEYYWYGFSSTAPQVQALYWFDVPTSVRQNGNLVPGSFSLNQNYPNPFNPTTSISYDIPNSGNVSLAVFDILGRKVADIVNSHQNAGSYTATWNGTNEYGVNVTSGTYFYQLKTDNGFVQTKKMILLK